MTTNTSTFTSQIQINSFVKDHLQYHKTIDGVIEYFSLHDLASSVNISDTNIEYRHHFFIEMLLVSDHGVVKNRSGKLVKLTVSSDGETWVRLRDKSGTWRRKKVSTMMSQAFLYRSKSVYRTDNKLTTLSNLCAVKKIIRPKNFVFESQNEFSGLLSSFDLITINDVMKHLHISFDQYRRMVGDLSVDVISDSAIKDYYVTHGGCDYRVNNYGKVCILSNGEYVPVRKPLLRKGRLIFRRVGNCGEIIETCIPSLMYRGIYGDKDRVITSYIDGNPYNLCLRNLRFGRK